MQVHHIFEGLDGPEGDFHSFLSATPSSPLPCMAGYCRICLQCPPPSFGSLNRALPRSSGDVVLRDHERGGHQHDKGRRLQ